MVFTFTIFDYALFGLMLISSAFVGVYHGCFRKQDTAKEYLLGGKNLGMWPVAMSVVSSTLSGFTLLSVPADVYRFGITYVLVVPNMITVGLASYYIFLPVFYKLQITSVYEYLALRFNRKVRILGSLMYTIQMFLFLPIVIYIPALALGQVTTLDIHLITLIVCAVCIFYTTIGGIKAVVWSDAIQFFVMLGALVVVVGVGIWRGGGLGTILQNAYEGGRLHVDTLSGLTLLSVPANIYQFGITYVLVVPNMITVGLASYHVFLPVFYKLQITSVYEYLAIRFNRKVRILGSLMYTIQMFLYLPIVIYIPALALGQVTTLDIHLITLIVCAVCIFYTTIGGIKAVVWSDAIQFFVMLGALVVVVGVGIWRGGGLGTILQNAYEGGRLHVDFDFNYVKRETFWAVAVGQASQVVSYFSCGQGSVQKFMSLPSFKTVKIALIWSQIGIGLIIFLSVFCGILMFSEYMNCDPLTANIVRNPDQILPFYVMDLVNFIPGLCGLFISGIFSAGLSTLSAIMNCLAATIYEDFISPFVSKKTSPKRVSQYLKWIVVIIGIESTAMVYVVEHLGGLVSLSLSFAGITSGTTLGLFCAGTLFPHVTSKGALAGGIVSLCTMTWIVMTAQWYKVKGYINYPTLPLSTAGCNGTINSTIIDVIPTSSSTVTDFEPFVLFRISFYWYSALGLTVAIIVALAVSCFTKAEKPLNKDCISPIMQFLIVEKEDKPPRYDDVALEKLNPQENCN